jgi:hypothetical protein
MLSKSTQHILRPFEGITNRSYRVVPLLILSPAMRRGLEYGIAICLGILCSYWIVGPAW